MKLNLEIKKLSYELEEAASARFRKSINSWVATLTGISVIIGIVVSVVGVKSTLDELNLKNQQLKEESIIRSHELFLNGVVDKIGGVKIFHNESSESFKKAQEKNPVFLEVGRESYSNEIQEAAYAVMISLVKQFPELHPVAKSAIDKRLETVGEHPQARKYSDELQTISPK